MPQAAQDPTRQKENAYQHRESKAITTINAIVIIIIVAIVIVIDIFIIIITITIIIVVVVVIIIIVVVIIIVSSYFGEVDAWIARPLAIDMSDGVSESCDWQRRTHCQSSGVRWCKL